MKYFLFFAQKITSNQREGRSGLNNLRNDLIQLNWFDGALALSVMNTKMRKSLILSDKNSVNTKTHSSQSC